MSRFGKISSLIVAGAAIVAGYLAWMTLGRGFSAREKPSPHEALVARMARRYATPRSMRNAKNPVPLSPEVLEMGRAHWADHCAICHGNDGKGRTQIGRNLYPPAPDMTAVETQSLTDGELFSIIENGVRLTGMPAWGNGSAESATQSWHLVHFIRHLPTLSGDELVQMERLNPKSPAEYQEMKAEEDFLAGATSPGAASQSDGAAPQQHKEEKP